MTYADIRHAEKSIVDFVVDRHPTLGREGMRLDRDEYQRELTEHVKAVMRAYNLPEGNQDG